MHRWQADQAVQMLQPQPPQRILDIATGTGLAPRACALITHAPEQRLRTKSLTRLNRSWETTFLTACCRLPPQCRGAAICKPMPPSCPSDRLRSMRYSASPRFPTCLTLQQAKQQRADHSTTGAHGCPWTSLFQGAVASEAAGLQRFD
jgi:hypothetical protein